jgi:hypothetical protein
MESPHSREGESHHGEALAEVTDGIVRLFRGSYGRRPTRTRSYLLDERYVVTVLGDTMTTVERTLVDSGTYGDGPGRAAHLSGGHGRVLQAGGAIGRRVASYHSHPMTDPDMGFEFFLLED